MLQRSGCRHQGPGTQEGLVGVTGQVQCLVVDFQRTDDGVAEAFVAPGPVEDLVLGPPLGELGAFEGKFPQRPSAADRPTSDQPGGIRGASRRAGRHADSARPRLAAVPTRGHRARPRTPHSRAADRIIPGSRRHDRRTHQRQARRTVPRAGWRSPRRLHLVLNHLPTWRPPLRWVCGLGCVVW